MGIGFAEGKSPLDAPAYRVHPIRVDLLVCVALGVDMVSVPLIFGDLL